MTAVKFCGLTLAEDVAFAVELGASYVGVIFADGPRALSDADAGRILARSAGRARCERVGVFGTDTPERIARSAAVVPLDVVQLHAATDAATVMAVRAAVPRPVWAVVRCAGAEMLADSGAAAAADGVVLDTYVAGRLGGTGVTLPWAALAERVAPWRGRTPLVLAGGLTPDNVGRAIAALRPDIVDVSSGVEDAPGRKDHILMRAFVDAVEAAG